MINALTQSPINIGKKIFEWKKEQYLKSKNSNVLQLG